jgi:L-serine dehydratase
MAERFEVMRESTERGLANNTPTHSGLTGLNAGLLKKYNDAREPLLGALGRRAMLIALAVAEENARMGRIVAAPTAGSCGILPGVIIAVGEHYKLPYEAQVMSLFTAAAIGYVIAEKATLAGADGGCQAECGSASAMAAAACVELMGGTPAMCADAAALAIKFLMGLICDPVCGLVEVPCVKRNASGATNALTAAEMALAGIKSAIPCDEVITAMGLVGKAIPQELRETSLGGLAVTATAKAYGKGGFKNV